MNKKEKSLLQAADIYFLLEDYTKASAYYYKL